MAQAQAFRIFCNQRREVQVPERVVPHIPIARVAMTNFIQSRRTGRPFIEVEFDADLVQEIVNWIDARVNVGRNFVIEQFAFFPGATVFELARFLPAAVHFGQDDLASQISERIAEGLRGRGVEDIRHQLGINNDLTEAEENALVEEETGLDLND